ncbi:MAG: OmpA family protein, partial [Crocinitomicaceae bacterium]|nr:OmpA family protein [Crocinitomicaceae bacterium]
PTLKVGDIYRPKENIRYNVNKAVIHKESQAELDTIAKFLIANPNIIIEVGVHLDTRVPDHYSKRLDEIRAHTVKSYLEFNGVNSQQLKSVGYMANQPIIAESEIEKMRSRKEKDAAHQTNRRTEFKILSISRRL